MNLIETFKQKKKPVKKNRTEGAAQNGEIERRSISSNCGSNIFIQAGSARYRNNCTYDKKN